MKENILLKILNDAYKLMLEENLVELTWRTPTERIYIRRKRKKNKLQVNQDIVSDENLKYEQFEEEDKKPLSREYIRSPITGTFYRSPSPGAPPFVSPPCEVKKGDTLCIVEAMKVMNEVKAEKDMKILRVLVEDAKEVKEGQELFEIS